MCDIHDSLIAFIDSISCESTPAMAVTLGTSHEHDATEKGNIVQLTTRIYIFQHLMCKRFVSMLGNFCEGFIFSFFTSQEQFSKSKSTKF